MKKRICIGLLLLWIFTAGMLYGAYFRAQLIGHSYYSWSRLCYETFETRIDVQGLFYQTTVHMKLKLGKDEGWRNNSRICETANAGDYSWTWIFNLPDEAYINGLEIWDAQSNAFVQADMLDLSTAEDLEDQNAPHALLREYRSREYDGTWSHFYRLQIEPVNRDESVELKMQWLSPCHMYWDVRRFFMNTRQFYFPSDRECNAHAPAVFRVLDHDHTAQAPQVVYNMPSIWSKSGGYWTAQTGPSDIQFSDNSVLSVEPENTSGPFFQVFDSQELKFYQLACSPDISLEQLPERHIVIGIDLREGYSVYRKNLIDNLYNPLIQSVSEKDSLIFLISDFNTIWLESDFQQASSAIIYASLEQTKQIVPQLNTLPFMLRDAVEFLNEKNLPGEVWIVSDDLDHGYPAGAVMDIVQQTYFSAENPVVFRIIDASDEWPPTYYINNKSYRGNQYLYENLSRLSKGSYVRFRDYDTYDYVDAGIDCFAPTVTSAEIDLVPTGGLAFSSVDLNRGKQHFHNMSRYFQIGLFDGSQPFDLHFFGNFQNELYHRVFDMHENEADIPQSIKQNVEQYWYGHYIRNELMLQPQSYETIQTIESLAVDHHVLTPYSGLVVPGPGGSIAFQKLTAEDSVFTETPSTHIANEPEAPKSFGLIAYPNPFNPETTVSLMWPPGSVAESMQLSIVNVLGQVVFQQTFETCTACGHLEFRWDGRNSSGHLLGSGTYFLTVESGAFIDHMKLVLIR